MAQGLSADRACSDKYGAEACCELGCISVPREHSGALLCIDVPVVRRRCTLWDFDRKSIRVDLGLCNEFIHRCAKTRREGGSELRTRRLVACM